MGIYTVVLMMQSPALSIQSNHPLLFSFHYTGIFSVSRIVTLPTVTLECNLVKQVESTVQHLGEGTQTGNTNML